MRSELLLSRSSTIDGLREIAPPSNILPTEILKIPNIYGLLPFARVEYM